MNIIYKSIVYLTFILVTIKINKFYIKISNFKNNQTLLIFDNFKKKYNFIYK